MPLAKECEKGENEWWRGKDGLNPGILQVAREGRGGSSRSVFPFSVPDCFVTGPFRMSLAVCVCGNTPHATLNQVGMYKDHKLAMTDDIMWRTGVLSSL